MTMTSHPPANGQVATRIDTRGMGVKPAGQLATLGAFLKERKSAIAAVGASHMDPERVYRMVVACVSRTPALQKCSIDSVFRASLQACEMGLEPGSALGEAYLVPFKGSCQLIPGYRGLITLARRSGEVEQVYAHCVYEGDEFEVRLGTEPHIHHIPKFGERTPDKILYVYAVAVLKGGIRQYDVMTKAEVNAIRGRSAAGGSGPWTTDYAEMARKTVVKRLCKYLPMSVEMRKAVALETAIDTGDWSAVEFDLPEANAPTVEEAQFKEAATEAAKPARGVNAVKDKIAQQQPTGTAPAAPATYEEFVIAAKAAGYPVQGEKDAESLVRSLLKPPADAVIDDAWFGQAIAALKPAETLNEHMSEEDRARLFDNE